MAAAKAKQATEPPGPKKLSEMSHEEIVAFARKRGLKIPPGWETLPTTSKPPPTHEAEGPPAAPQPAAKPKISKEELLARARAYAESRGINVPETPKAPPPGSPLARAHEMMRRKMAAAKAKQGASATPAAPKPPEAKAPPTPRVAVMDEAAWLASDDPRTMLRLLRGKASGRRLRLFANACLRSTWLWRYVQQFHLQVEVNERIAEGLEDRVKLAAAHTLLTDAVDICETELEAFGEERGQAYMEAFAALKALPEETLESEWRTIDEEVGDEYPITDEEEEWENRRDALSFLQAALDSDAWVGAVHIAHFDSESLSTGDVERAWFSILLRDIFGNPFRPSPPLPAAVLAWNDRLVPRLAQVVYDERHLPEGTLDPCLIGILHAALLDAGCEDEELIAHLRSPGPHVRGCWAVDVVLQKPA